MKTKHTPGPWVADGSEITNETWVCGADGKRICTMTPSFADWSNARLIAAAPELLEFAKEFLRVWADAGVTDSPLEAQSRAAISKATGE